MKKLLPLLLIVLIAFSCKTKGWPAADKKEFLTTCTAAAVRGGMENAKANSYCDCMQKKLEAKYPDVKQASKVTEQEMQSDAWIKEVKDCLK